MKSRSIHLLQSDYQNQSTFVENLRPGKAICGTPPAETVLEHFEGHSGRLADPALETPVDSCAQGFESQQGSGGILNLTTLIFVSSFYCKGTDKGRGSGGTDTTEQTGQGTK